MDRRKFSLLSVTSLIGGLFSNKAKASTQEWPPEPATVTPPPAPSEVDWMELICKNDNCKSAFKMHTSQTGYPVCPRCGSGWMNDIVLVRSPELVSMSKMLRALDPDQLADGGACGAGYLATRTAYTPPVPKKIRNYDHNYKEIMEDRASTDIPRGPAIPGQMKG